MNIRILKTFIMAAEYQNFRVVSEKMFITQPAVTLQIKQIEKELGEKLFLKSGRNITLTDFGRLFYKEARQIVSQYEDSLTIVNRYKQGYHKTLRIAISPMFADTILPSILRQYIKQHPNVEVAIKVIESKEISTAIEQGEVDIGLSCMPGYVNVKTIKFHEESVRLVCNHDGYDAESGPIIDAKDLLEENILLTDNHPVYWHSLKEELVKNIPSLKSISVNQSHVAKRFVLEGIGVSFLPRSVINREILEGRLLEVPVHFLKLPKASMYIIYKNKHDLIAEFISFISDFHYS